MSFIPNLTYNIASTVWSGTTAALGKGTTGKAATSTTLTSPGNHHSHRHSGSNNSSSSNTNGHSHGSNNNSNISNSNNKRYSHSRRPSNNNYNFSRSNPNGLSTSSPMTPPHSPNHYSQGTSHPSSSSFTTSSDRRSARKRDSTLGSSSTTPRTPPSSPQLGSADTNESQPSLPSSHNFSRKRNYNSSSNSSSHHSHHGRNNQQYYSSHNHSHSHSSNSNTQQQHNDRHHQQQPQQQQQQGDSETKKNMDPLKAPKTAEERYKIVDEILETENLYRVLAVSRTATAEEIRRAYIAKSRVCHPDKFPEYPRATEAFQKLSLAYETLSKPSSRFVYDSTGGSSRSTMLGSDETLQNVLSQVFFEFMDGDFEVIRNMINTMNNTTGGVRLGDDVIGVIEEMFLRLRFVLHGCRKYLTLVHDEVQQLSEIHHSMRSLAYLDVLGRFRLTLKLSKVMLTIPMIIQDEMRREIAVAAALEGGSDQEEKEANAKKNAGIVGTVFLNDRVETVLKKVVSAIETGERWV